MAKRGHKHKVGKKKGGKKAHKGHVRLEPTLKHMGKKSAHKRTRRKKG